MHTKGCISPQCSAKRVPKTASPEYVFLRDAFSDVPISLSCKSRVLTLATPVNSLSVLGACNNMYPGFGASDPLSTLIESDAIYVASYSLSPICLQAPCAPLGTGCVSPLRKKVPSDEKVSMFFPTPLGRLAVTIHAPIRPRLVSTPVPWRVPTDAAHPATTTAMIKTQQNRSSAVHSFYPSM